MPITAFLPPVGVLTAAGQALRANASTRPEPLLSHPRAASGGALCTLNQMNIVPTTDVDGLADMVSARPGERGL